MSGIIDLENIKHKCRICLMSSNQMISLTCKLDEENNEDMQICDALEKIFAVKVISNCKYPEGICLTCYEYIKMSYILKTTFDKSQYILEKFVSFLSHKTSNEDNPEDGEESYNEGNCISGVESKIDIKKDTVEESSPLTESNDFVIVQVTDDCDEEPTMLENINDFEETEGSDISNNESISKLFNENRDGEQEISQSEMSIAEVVSDSDILEDSDSSNCCQVCSKWFINKDKLEQHMNAYHNCDYCDEQFPTFLNKQHHIKRKHKYAKIVKCDICDMVFESTKSRSYHIKTKHNVKKFYCKICGKGFHFENNLRMHMDTHSKDQFKEICPECGKGFHYRGGLFYHMKIHRGERNYLCTYCSARFLNVSGLKKHILIHTGEKPCQCEYCGKSFRSSSILKKHEKIHTGQRPHSCKYCGKGFISTYNLKVHMAGHNGAYACQFCEKSYLNEEVLGLHMKFKHNVKELIKMEYSE